MKSKTKKKPTKPAKSKNRTPAPAPTSPPDAGPALVPATMPLESGYEWIRAFVSADGDLRWEYQALNTTVQGRDDYDQDVSEWSDEDIRRQTCNYLDLGYQYAHLIEIVRE